MSAVGCGDSDSGAEASTESGSVGTESVGTPEGTTRDSSTRGGNSTDSDGSLTETSSGSGDSSDSGDTEDRSSDTDVVDPVPCRTAVYGDLEADIWNPLPGAPFGDVCACANGFPEVCGSTFCAGAFAFSGAAFDSVRNRVVQWGGGHDDYYGNELYAFDLSTATWSMLTDPSPPTNPGSCVETLEDGAPNSRHTYGGLAILPRSDQLFAIGGSLACGPGDGSASAWLYSFGDRSWERIEPEFVGFAPDEDPRDDLYGFSTLEIVSAYDDVAQEVFVETTFSLSSYSARTNTWTKRLDVFDHLDGRWGERNAVIAGPQRLMFSMGEGTIIAYDLSESGGFETWTTQGPQAVVDASAPGLLYDPVREVVVGLAAGRLYALNLRSRTWTMLPDELPDVGDRTWGRFRYAECEDAYVAVTDDPERPVYLYRR